MSGRSESRSLWSRIAAGELQHDPDGPGVDLHAWIRDVASNLLVADEESDAQRRRRAVMRAVGLDGKPDGYATLRAFVLEPQWDFDAVGREEPTRIERLRETVHAARAAGLLTGVYADEFDETKACDLVRDIRAGRA